MSQIHILDGQSDSVLDTITKPFIISDLHKRSLKDFLETFDFTTFADKRFSQHLTRRNRIVIPQEDQGYTEFIIHEVGKYRSGQGLITEVYTSASYLEISKQAIIEPQSYTELSASMLAGKAVEGTEWQVGIVEGQGIRTIHLAEYYDPFRLLKLIAREFNLELHFRVKVDGNKIVGRYVDLLDRIGQWKGREVEFGKDLMGIRRIEKTDDIVTALKGLGPEKEDGTRMELLVTDEDALQRWGRNGKHLIEVYEPESSNQDMTHQRLKVLTENALEKRMNAIVEYECDVADLEHVPGMQNKKIRFGDTIKIKDTKFNPPLYIEARVHTLERSIVDKSQKKIELGDFVEYTEKEVKSIWKQLQDQIKQRLTHHEMVEYAYDKLTVDKKDETVSTEGKTFAELMGKNAKEHADTVSTTAETNAKEHAKEQDALLKTDVQRYADTSAQSALDDAKMYAVAKEAYDIQMQKIAKDIADRAPIKYVDGQLKHAIDGLEVGGRNLLSNSNFSKGLEGWSNNDPTISIVTEDGKNLVSLGTVGRGIYRYPTEMEEGNKYTVSFYAKGSTDGSQVRVGFLNQPIQTVVPLTTQLKKYEVTFTETIDKTKNTLFHIYLYAGAVSITDIMLVKGGKAIDWTPAPEDIFSSIEKKADQSTTYTIEDVEDRLNNFVGVTKYNADMNGVITNLNDFGTRFEQNEKAITLKADDTKVNQLEGSLTDKIGSVDVKADGIVQSVSEVWTEVSNIGRWTKDYRVRTLNPMNLTESDGSPLNPDWTYEMTAKTTNTGTDSTAIAVFRSNGVGGWDLEILYELGSKTSNRPEFFLDANGLPTLRLYNHTTYYNVEVMHEKVRGRTSPNSATNARVTSTESNLQIFKDEVNISSVKNSIGSLEGWVQSAETELSITPGEFDLIVKKDGVIGAINAQPAQFLIDFAKVKITNELEAKHIKSLVGLNVNNQFIVDAQGNVRFAGNLQGASGTFGNVSVTDGDFKMQKDGAEYSVTPRRNLIKDHGFELMRIDWSLQNQDTVTYNWIDVPPPLEGFSEPWGIYGKPKIALEWNPDNYKALPMFGQRAICVRDAHFVKQQIYEGIAAGQTYTISGFFKRQWNTTGGQPRFEVDYLKYSPTNGTMQRIRLINQIFPTVPADYSVVRYSATFTVPADFDFRNADEIEIKISGGNTNWIQCDGVQLVEGTIATPYLNEDSIWEITKGNYPIQFNQITMWSGTYYPLATHTITPTKKLSECRNGWLLVWQAFNPSNNTKVNSDFQYSYIPKAAAEQPGTGHRYMLSRGEGIINKYLYITDSTIKGLAGNGATNNNLMVLAEVREW